MSCLQKETPTTCYRGHQIMCLLPRAVSHQRAFLRTVFLPRFVILRVAYFQDQHGCSLWQLIVKILFQEPNMIFHLLLSLGSTFLILVLYNSWTFFMKCQLCLPASFSSLSRDPQLVATPSHGFCFSLYGPCCIAAVLSLGR